MTEQELFTEGETDPGPEGAWCRVCDELKPLHEYYEAVVQARQGTVRFVHCTVNECNDCRLERGRHKRVARKYGLTPTQHKDLMSTEFCGICKQGLRTALGHPAIDHCHETGAVRGVLCSLCNMALGVAGDQVAAVETWTSSALQYLRRNALQ